MKEKDRPNRTLQIRTPVRRENAQLYILISLVSFGGSVMATRLFLELTGYPKIGSGELHIAHVLWGGLILFIAALLPLVFANRWVFTAGAILSGVGVGLFIDEVGKFVTLSNDYFFPPAAPIIYAFFLLTVVLYLRIRKRPTQDPRDELYRVLDGLTELLDQDLDPVEKSLLLHRLKHISTSSSDPDLADLAKSLSAFLIKENLQLAPRRMPIDIRFRKWLVKFENRHLPRRRYRWAITFLIGLVGVIALFQFVSIAPILFSRTHPLESLLTLLLQKGDIRSATMAAWSLAYIALQGLFGTSMIIGGGLFAVGLEKRGLDLASIGLVVSLTAINLLAFYVDQFSASINALLQLLVLLAITLFRRRFIPPSFTKTK